MAMAAKKTARSDGFREVVQGCTWVTFAEVEREREKHTESVELQQEYPSSRAHTLKAVRCRLIGGAHLPRKEVGLWMEKRIVIL